MLKILAGPSSHDPTGVRHDAPQTPTRREECEELLVRAARNLYRSDPDTVIDRLPESGLSEDDQEAILRSE